MHHWKETAEILARLSCLSRTGGSRAAVATVVGTAGSAYRRPGAKLLVLDDGDTIGSVSAGCLDADVREVAQAVIETDRPVLRRYDMRDENDPIGSLGMGCRGVIDVFVQPAATGGFSLVAESLATLLAAESPLAAVTVVSGDEAGRMMAIALPTAADPASRRYGSLGDPALDEQMLVRVREAEANRRAAVSLVSGRSVFIDVLRPPPHLVVCGAGSDAIPLVAYAADAGFRVTVLDHRSGLLDATRFPGASRRQHAAPDDPAVILPPAARTLAIIKTHSLAHDSAWLRRFLALGVPYAGVLGPRARTERMLAELDDAAIGPDARDRVFGPVGLDLGADGPQQVAISIVAELLAFVSRRSPRHLWERCKPIHD
jgi:xanthine dehydrogenase accessory factor